MNIGQTAVTLSDGTVVLFKPFVTRKIAKEFANRQFAGTEYDEKGKVKIKFDISASNDTNDWLITALVESAQNAGAAVTVDMDFVNNLKVADYDLLKEQADALFRPKTEEEKKA